MNTETWTKVPYRKDGAEGIRYTRSELGTGLKSFVRVSRVPDYILRQLEDNDNVEVPMPTKRCLFCDAQSTKQRMVNLVTVELCNYHYYYSNVGKIAAELRLQQSRKELNGTDTEIPKTSKPKGKESKTAKSQDGRQKRGRPKRTPSTRQGS